jgi:hypothetical protein
MRPFRRALVFIAALALLAACATAPVGLPVAPPRFIVGDHWQYRVTDNLRRGVVSQFDVEVVAMAGDVATMRIVKVDGEARSEWTEEIEGGGGLRAGMLNDSARRFTPAAALLAFPLEQGKTWRQVVPTFRADIQLPDQILIYGDVQGRAPVTAPGGSFDAIQIYRVVQFDDASFWRSRTIRRDRVWYAPEVKGPVREMREAQYVERGDTETTAIYTERTITELVSFRPGQ